MANQKPRPQFDRLSYPLGARQVESLDSMLEYLFKEQKRMRSLLGASDADAVSSLAGLSDVSVPSPTDNYVLTFNSSTGLWEAEAPASGTVALDDLTDVVITSAKREDTLVYNGTNWVNDPRFFYRRMIGWNAAYNTTAPNLQGSTTTATTAGTASALTDTAGGFVRYTTTTVTNGAAGWRLTNSSNGFVRGGHLPHARFRIRTGAAVTGCRFYVGLRPAAATPTADTESDVIIFRFSTVTPDAAWMAICDTAGTRTTTSTGVAVAANTVYLMDIRVVSANSVLFTINGTTIEITANIPTATELALHCTVSNISAGGAGTDRVIDIGSGYLDGN